MIVDHLDQLKLSDDMLDTRGNELNSLRYLAEGLEFLNIQIKRIEDKVVEQLPCNQVHLFYGNAPGFEWIPLGLVACAFHWYAVSACNYARMVGWMANGGDSKEASKYVREVLPAVHRWRNKVAAHFARTDPREDDTPADLAMSVMFPVGFEDDAFYANPLTVGIRVSGQTTTSRGDMRWSLTRTHSDLCHRYWPGTLSYKEGGNGT